MNVKSHPKERIFNPALYLMNDSARANHLQKKMTGQIQGLISSNLHDLKPKKKRGDYHRLYIGMYLPCLGIPLPSKKQHIETLAEWLPLGNLIHF